MNTPQERLQNRVNAIHKEIMALSRLAGIEHRFTEIEIEMVEIFLTRSLSETIKKLREGHKPFKLDGDNG